MWSCDNDIVRIDATLRLDAAAPNLVTPPKHCHSERSKPTPFPRVRFLRTRRLAQRGICCCFCLCLPGAPQPTNGTGLGFLSTNCL
jgi:hypothetical protein